MEVDIVFHESLCQDFVILLDRSLRNDAFDIVVAEALWTFNTNDARMAGVDVSDNVSVEAFSADGGVMMVMVGVEGRKGIRRLVFHANRTVAHTVRGQGVLESVGFSLCRMHDEHVVVIFAVIHIEVCTRRKGYLWYAGLVCCEGRCVCDKAHQRHALASQYQRHEVGLWIGQISEVRAGRVCLQSSHSM
jgi:hypothetical protein